MHRTNFKEETRSVECSEAAQDICTTSEKLRVKDDNISVELKKAVDYIE